MQDAPESLELVVDVADPLDLLVDLCRPTGAFLPCAARPRAPRGVDANVVLRVRVDARDDPMRVVCVVVASAPSDREGVRVRFPNANVHALTLLRTFAPILADRAPASARQKVVQRADDVGVVHALDALARGREIVVPTEGPVLPGERVQLTVGDAWAQSIAMVSLLSTELTYDGEGYAARAKLVDDAGKKVLKRFLERVARAIAPRDSSRLVV